MSDNIETPANAEKETKRDDISIKFSKKLANNFTDKEGKEFVSVKIPNADPEDHRQWEEFVLPADKVKEDLYSKKCLYAYLPADGSTTLTRSIKPETPDGEWGKEKRKVRNTDLKQMVESYKQRDKGKDVR